MLKVLGRSSSINVRKVLWTCEEIGVPFESEEWGSASLSIQTPEFLALNPMGMIPVIIDGDFVLWESNVICRYLCTQYERTDLLPVQAKPRAEVEKWMDWQATELNNSWRYAFMALVRHSSEHKDEDALAASVADWSRHIAILDRHLLFGGPYITGDTFTLADVVLGLSIHRWFMTPFQHPDYKAVAAYYQRLSDRPAFIKYGRNGIA